MCVCCFYRFVDYRFIVARNESNIQVLVLFPQTTGMELVSFALSCLRVSFVNRSFSASVMDASVFALLLARDREQKGWWKSARELDDFLTTNSL